MLDTSPGKGKRCHSIREVMTRKNFPATGNNCTNHHNFRITMSNQVNVCNLVVPKARRTGELSWTTWLSLTTRGEQQGMADLLQRWGKREGEAWASAVLRYDNTAERIEGFRWKLFDFNQEVFFKASRSRMWKACKNDKVKQKQYY